MQSLCRLCNSVLKAAQTHQLLVAICGTVVWQSAVHEAQRGCFAGRGAVSSYMKVVPSIASVRFLYEVLIQSWGTGGIRRYRTMEQG